MAGAEENLYKSFAATFGDILSTCGIGKDRRIVVPGNHDVSRTIVEATSMLTIGALSMLSNEESFLNQLPNLNQAFFNNKLKNYTEFECEFAKYTCCQDNLGGRGWDLPEGIGIYCLNTAICSFAGVEDSRTSKRIDDRGQLSIDTRALYQWEQSTQSRFRILVMHHPIDWLSEWARIELDKIISQSFNMVLFGHFHIGVSKFLFMGERGQLMSMAPPLFTRKNEKIGYSIISFDTETGTAQVRYRDWSQHNNFVTGSTSSGTEDGITHFNLFDPGSFTSVSKLDHTSKSPQPTEEVLEIEFCEASTCYSSRRQLWIDRDFSKHPESRNSRELREISPPESIIDTPRACILRAPEGFGLSAYARYAALTYYRKSDKKKCLVVANMDDIPHHKSGAVAYMSKRLLLLSVQRSAVSGIILDHWTGSQSDIRILRYITEEYPGIPAILFQSFSHFLEIEGLSSSKEAQDLEAIYLKSLSKARIRELTRIYIEEVSADLDEDAVTKKIIEDIDSLNMHRTPLNCLLLLKAIEREFDESPVNRTQMLSNVLHAMFYQFDKIPKYSTRPDIKDCEFALGYLCEWLTRANRRTFSKTEFLQKINEYLTIQLIGLDIEVLFNFLFTERILIARGIEFGFRHGYWFCYFVALRMHHKRDFSEFILEDLRYSAFPEVIEFYTGIDRMRNDALEVLDRDLRKLDGEFLARTGIAKEFNPFSVAQWNPSAEAVDRMQEEVVDSIRESSLPDEVKDAVADGTYDCSKPYHQEVSQFITRSSLTQMIQAMKAAARALRNCDHASPALREKLLESVMDCWVRMCQTLAMLSPVLACKRHAECDGMGFILTEDFRREDSPNVLWKQIIEAITDNVVNWYQCDLFSKKLVPLMISYMKSRKGRIEEFLVVYLMILQRPNGWAEVAQRFALESPKNSFYLYKVYVLSRHEFRLGYAKEHARQQMRRTAAIAVARHHTKSKRPNNSLINRAAEVLDSEIESERRDAPTTE